MKAHWLQHVPFEELGEIKTYLTKNGIQTTVTRLYDGEVVPEKKDFDLLIVMGGPMGVYDEPDFPWLKNEKVFVEAAIQEGKKVLGICLGAQIIAEVLGAKVYKGERKEIGWFDVKMTKGCQETPYKRIFENSLEVFHWHGDTFSLPDRAVNLCESAVTRNQAFLYQENVLALQFHIEMTPEGIDTLLKNCGDDIDGTEFTQDEELIKKKIKKTVACNKPLFSLLDVFLKRADYR